MTETNHATITARLAAAGLRVKPLVWRRNESSCQQTRWNAAKLGVLYEVMRNGRQDTRGRYSAYIYILENKEVAVGTSEHCIAACERHHAEAVLAMLEPIPSEEKM